MCVAKVYEINPERVEESGLLKNLAEMLLDGNGMVVSNAVVAITEIQNKKGTFVTLTPKLIHQLLNALPECAEWGRVYILDFLSENTLCHEAEVTLQLFSEQTITRVIPNLAHSNPALVLSSVKLILKLMENIKNTDKIRSYCRKLAPPLISLMSTEAELMYVAVKNINLILMRYPQLFEKEVRIFFCNF